MSGSSSNQPRRHNSCDADDPRKCKIAEGLSEEAAEHAVKRVFAILGVDIDKPESVEEFRADLRFGKKMRKAADHGTMAFVAVAVTGMCYAFYAGILSKLGGGNG